MTKTQNTPVSRYQALLAKGCLCGTERVPFVPCPLHSGPSDNRGLRAYFEAGMPLGFPVDATCAICGADSLLYPDVQAEDPDNFDGGPPKHRRTLICPRCSVAGLERALVAEVEASGRHVLNTKRVFA